MEKAHVSWHANVDTHHHHDDGSMHFDDSDDSVPHNHIDHGTGSALLSVASDRDLPSLRPPSPYVLANAHAAHWSPDPPLRPPRLLA